MAIWPHCAPLSSGVMDFSMSIALERQSRASVVVQPVLVQLGHHIDEARGTAGLSYFSAQKAGFRTRGFAGVA
jgi:hypothetical protein